MVLKLNRFIFLFYSLFLFINKLYSHPHIFIDYSFEFYYNKDTLSEIKVIWIFDKMNSEMMANYFDLDKDRKINDKEIKNIIENSFSGIIEYKYFTYIYFNDKLFRIKEHKDFKAELSNGIFIYSFIIPINKKISDKIVIKISCYDPEIYIDFTMMKEYLIIKNECLYENVITIIDNSKSQKYFEGFVASKEIQINYKKR